MIKKLLFLGFLLSCLLGFSQRYKSTNTYIKFFSDAPMEDIEAINENASSLVDLSNMAIVIVVPIKSFSFEKKLMEEHFNENYLESEKFPKAIFKGKLVNWDGSNGITNATAEGTLEMHGVTKDITIEGELDFNGAELKLSTVFPIKLKDYKIKIPKAVFYNIAEEVEVTANLEYSPYEKD
ncbi:YceI family protein [Ekhidna sp.]|uniref:YceI family protein n=1 Tax=Ekhidna sp. TaxID=2608089 RepID=UPI003B506FAB